MNKGFVFSLEACIALLIFSFACMTLFSPQEISLKEIIILQQGNDLLKFWSVDYPNASEALEDCENFFGKKFELRIDGKTIHEYEGKGERISSSAVLLDNFLNERMFEITVYFD